MNTDSIYLPEFAGVRYAQATASRLDIEHHLRRCEGDFVPPLAQREDLQSYADRIRHDAVTFEAWAPTGLVGLVAAHLGDAGGVVGFVTTVSVEEDYRGQGIARSLLVQCMDAARKRGIDRLRLQVARANASALCLFRQLGFEAVNADGDDIVMARVLDRKGPYGR